MRSGDPLAEVFETVTRRGSIFTGERFNFASDGSVVGEDLIRRGVHRVHAVGGCRVSIGRCGAVRTRSTRTCGWAASGMGTLRERRRRSSDGKNNQDIKSKFHASLL